MAGNARASLFLLRWPLLRGAVLRGASGLRRLRCSLTTKASSGEERGREWGAVARMTDTTLDLDLKQLAKDDTVTPHVAPQTHRAAKDSKRTAQPRTHVAPQRTAHLRLHIHDPLYLPC